MILPLLVLVLCAEAGERLTIGDLQRDYDSRGGCVLQLPHQFAKKEGEAIFISNREKQAWVNVDGADAELALSKPPATETKQQAEVGDRASYTYANSEIEVQVDYVVTGVCPRGKADCGVTDYDAVLTVKRGKASKRVAAKAVCGG